MINLSKLHNCTTNDILQISLESVAPKSGELYIYELSTLEEILNDEQTEAVRGKLKESGTHVFQLTNQSRINSYLEQEVIFVARY